MTEPGSEAPRPKRMDTLKRKVLGRFSRQSGIPTENVQSPEDILSVFAEPESEDQSPMPEMDVWSDTEEGSESQYTFEAPPPTDLSQLALLPKTDAIVADINLLFPHKEASDAAPEVEEEKLLSEILSPRTEQDEAGFTRQIYTLRDNTFAFRGINELPYYPTLRSSSTALVGETPRHIPQEEFFYVSSGY